MSHICRKSIPFLLLGIFCSVSLFGQGLYWEGKETMRRGPQNRERDTKYYAMPKMLKSVQGEDMQTIVRIDKGEVISINDRRKTYSVVTFDDIEKMMQGPPGGAPRMPPDRMEEMKKQMEQMPPEQRKMMEEMMSKRFGGGQGDEDTVYTIAKTDETKKIAGYNATKYVITHGGKEFGTVWASTEVPMSDVLRKDFMELRNKMTSIVNRGSRWYRDIPGFPLDVQTEMFSSTVTKIEEKSTPASAFEVPAGYEKKDMMEMGPGRQGRGRPPMDGNRPPKKDEDKDQE